MKNQPTIIPDYPEADYESNKKLLDKLDKIVEKREENKGDVSKKPLK